MPRRKRAKGKKPKRRRRHPYNVEQSLPIRAANYHELQIREHYIDTSEKIRFDADDLKEFQIKAVVIDLNSPSLPFFRRYPGFLPTVDEKFMSQKFPTFKEPPVGTSKPGYDIEHGLAGLKLFFEKYYFRWLEYMLPLGLTRTAQDRAVDKIREYDWLGEEHLCAFPVPKPLKGLYEYPRWFASDFDGDYRQHEPFPHLRIRITHEINGDDRLLRGELLGIMRAMTGRSKQKPFSSHCVIPVLAWSLMGPQHARILVSYIEGDDLVIGYSKLYDFRTRDDCSIHLFMRWLFCSAYGITRENQKVLRRNS